MITVRYFDLHCDTPYEMYKNKVDYSNGSLAVNSKYRNQFSKSAIINAIWTPDNCISQRDNYINIYNYFKKCCTIDTAIERKHTNLLSVEGAGFIETADDVDRLYSDGVRIITLTWNGANRLAHGCNSFGGITPLGKAVIKRMNELNMMLDISHLNDECAFEAVGLSNKPIATHTACRTVYYHKRNLSDGILKAVLEKGGIVGLCLYPKFLGDENVCRSFLLHLNHLMSFEYPESICLGTDFDGANMGSINNAGDLIKLYDYLKDKGISENTADCIFYGNAYGYFEKALPEGE